MNKILIRAFLIITMVSPFACLAEEAKTDGASDKKCHKEHSKAYEEKKKQTEEEIEHEIELNNR